MTAKTYFIDVDGTIVKHVSNDDLDRTLENNKILEEVLLPGVHELWSAFEANDKIIITTARKEAHRKITEAIFTSNNLRFDVMLMDLTSGQRILINDTPNLLEKKAIAINVKRDVGFSL
jgi:uncharacterized HAD superfamily protein